MLIEIFGKKVPTTPKELIDPSHSAVVVVDAQNDFCKKGGLTEEYWGELAGYSKTIKNIKRLIDAAMKVGIPIIFTMNTSLPNHATESASHIHFLIRGWAGGDVKRIPTCTVEGTWGEQIADELKPDHKLIVVKKNRASAFTHTNFDLVLRNHNIKTLVVTGFVTDQCVLTTARDADCFDYFVVVARDCVNSPRKKLHRAAMSLMEWRLNVMSSSDIINVWAI